MGAFIRVMVQALEDLSARLQAFGQGTGGVEGGLEDLEDLRAEVVPQHRFLQRLTLRLFDEMASAVNMVGLVHQAQALQALRNKLQEVLEHAERLLALSDDFGEEPGEDKLPSIEAAAEKKERLLEELVGELDALFRTAGPPGKPAAAPPAGTG